MTSNTGKWSYQSSSLGHTSGVLTEPVSFFGSSSTILVLLLLIEERQTNIMLVAKCSVGGGGEGSYTDVKICLQIPLGHTGSGRISEG